MKKLGRLPDVRGIKRGIGKQRGLDPEIPLLPGMVGEIVDLLPPALRDLTRRLGNRAMDQKLAKRLLSLQADFPLASLPELIVYDWLRRQGVQFEFQGSLAGGRGLRGGIVPDFVIPFGGNAMVWRVQGEYWHTLPGTRAKDLDERLRMLGQTFDGIRITTVVDLWEDDLWRNRERVLESAMAGIGVRDGG